MLIACTDCRRQYDVGDLKPGAKIRCYCGTLNDIPKQKPRDAVMAHCSSCGGALKKEQKTCEFCGSEILQGIRDMGEVCPKCMARMVKNAKYCNTCGVAIEPQAVLKAVTSKSCPRCSAPLTICELADAAFIECTKCGGIWLDESSFGRLSREAEEDAKETLPMADTVRAGAEPSIGQRVQYLACPVCGDRMNRKNFASVSGVVIDWCRGHGFWFDAHELELILTFIRKGGLRQARVREDERRTREMQKAADDMRAARHAAQIAPYRGPPARPPAAIDLITMLVDGVTGFFRK